MEEEQNNEEISPESGLTLKQERFCREYLIDLNAVAAARRAGYSEKGAQNTGCRILNLPAAKAFLKAEREKINARMSVAAEVANNELLDLAFSERDKFFDSEGNLVNPMLLPEHLRGAVQAETQRIKRHANETTITTYKLYNKIQMMEKIAKRGGDMNRHAKPAEGGSSWALLPDGTIKEY